MQLTRIKGFFPYMLVVFFNTFVDIGHKVLIQDNLYQTSTGPVYTTLSAIINGLILVPYLFLFTPAGFIADKYAKSWVLKITALLAIPLTVLITWSYYQGYFVLAFSATLLLATQSAINSPAKYGYIKELFGKECLTQANAIVQTLTIIAILAATLVFTYFFNIFIHRQGLEQATNPSVLLQAVAPIGFILIACSLLEAAMTFRLPTVTAADPTSRYRFKDYLRGKKLKSYLKKTTENHIIFTCILGLSIFWAVNQVLLASYGAFLKENLPQSGVLFAQGSLAFGGIGILLGAIYAGKVSRGFIEIGLIPIATVGISIGLLLLPMLVHQWSIILLFLVYGFFGGMLVVPLNALIQFHAPRKRLGKILSGNNFIQNCFMIVFLLFTVLSSMIGIDSRLLLYILFFIAATVSVYTLVSLPQSLIRYLIYFIASKFYHINVYQLDNLPSTGGVLLLGNHVSYIDWAILQIACPRPIRFVMEKSIYETWYLTWLLKKFGTIPIARNASDLALKEIHNALNAGEVVALFPEGRLSANGQLGFFHRGFELAAQDTHAVIIPFYLHGLWGAKLSRAPKYIKQNQITSRRLSVIYGPALPVTAKAELVKQRVRELSIKAWKLSTNDMSNIAREWLFQVKSQPNKIAVIEENKRAIKQIKLLNLVLYLAQQWKKSLKKEQHIGIIMPSSLGGIIANLSLWMLGKTVVNLNYTSGLAALKIFTEQAHIKTIVTSRQFLEKLKSKGCDVEEVLMNKQVFLLEEMFGKNRRAAIIFYAFVARYLPFFLLEFLFAKSCDVNETAAILFSSGSEGRPKGIELSHRNLLSNVHQVASVFSLQEDDVVMNCLPLFHAFGLTVTTLMPLLKGVPMVCYPDPTNALAIAKLIFRNKVSLFCSTSSFLNLFVKNPKILGMMLSSLRLVVAGAEKLSPAVYNGFKEKFHLTVYEGYGATEVAPVASCNLPDQLSPEDWHIYQAHKPGSVGLPLPGCAFRIVEPQSLQELPIDEEGLILIGGTQVMKGYLQDPERTAAALIVEDEYVWYKSGDKGRLDQDGYLTIIDRYARFAKIAGEMVSLGQAEQCWQKILGDSIELIAVNYPDIEKGEQLALLYVGAATPEKIKEQLVQSELSRLYLPKTMIQLQELPKLGNGKRDYVTAKKMIMDPSARKGIIAWK